MWVFFPQMESLFGSLPEMLDFQKVFLQTLEEKISSSPNFNTLETPVQFKVDMPNAFIANMAFIHTLICNIGDQWCAAVL